MIIKTLVLDIYISESNSLKSKRRILKSIIAKSRQKFNVAVSELEFLEDHKRSTIGFVTISNSNIYADKVLDNCLNLIETEYSVDIINIYKDRN